MEGGKTLSSTTETRVMSMRFDNQDFERNVSQTMSSLNKLKEKLKFSKRDNSGFKEIEKQAKNVNLKPFENTFDRIGESIKFKTVAKIEFMKSKVRELIDIGDRMVKAFTIEPISSGLNEYETQINAVQTILANTESKGSTIDDVNNALDQLNKYADLTIYNFTEMTRNIGTFTAAGVGLEDSVQAIKGIANLAAISGSTSQQASTAMYQLSQALATGRIALQDWNSVVNAGMGGEVFQTALKRTSEVMKTGAEKAIKANGSFRESLTKGKWLTKEVLTETLAQFAGAYDEAELLAKGYSKQQAQDILKMADTATQAATKVKTFSQLIDTLKEAAQSGWTQTWQLVLGNFEEAKTTFSEASDFFGKVIEKSANKRNSLIKGALQNVVSESDWDKLEKAGLATKSLEKTLEKVAKDSGVPIRQIMKNSKSFKESLKEGWLSSDILKKALKSDGTDIQKSTKSISKSLEEYKTIAKEVIKGNWGNGQDRKDKMAKAGKNYVAIQTVVNKMMRGEVVELDKLSKAELKVMGLTKEHAKTLKKLSEESKATGKPLDELLQKMERRTGRELLIDGIRHSIEALSVVLKSIKKAWHNVFEPLNSSTLYNAIASFEQFTKSLILNKDNAKKLRVSFQGLFTVIKWVVDITKAGFKIAVNVANAVLSKFNLNILDVTSGIGNAIISFDKWVKKHNIVSKVVDATSNAIVQLIKFIGSLGKALLNSNAVKTLFNDISSGVKEFVETFKRNAVGKQIVQFFNEFIEKIKGLKNLSLKDTLSSIGTYISELFTKIHNAITIPKSFENAFDKIASIIKKAKAAIQSEVKDNGIFGPIASIFAGVVIIKSVGKLSKIFGKLVDILSVPLEALKEIGSKLIGVFSKIGKAISVKLKSEAFLTIAKGITLLAASLWVLAQIPTSALIRSAGALIIVTGAITGMVVAFGKNNNIGLAKVSGSMVAMAASLMILVNTMRKMDKINPDHIIRNMIILAALGTGMVVFARSLKNVDGMGKSMLTFISMALALRTMVNVLIKLDTANLDDLPKDLMVIAGILWTMSKVSKVGGNTSIKSMVGLITMALALRTFVTTLTKMAKIPFETVIEGLFRMKFIMAQFVLLIAASRLAGKHAIGAGVMILAISSAMLIMGLAIRSMAGIKSSTMDKATNVMTRVLALFTIMIAVSNLAGKRAMQAGVMLIMVAGAITALSVAFALLSTIKEDKLLSAIDAIERVMMGFAVLIAATKFSNDCNKNIMMFAISIGAMAIALGGLSIIKTDKLLSATAALSTVMGMFSLLVKSTKDSGKATTTLILLTGIVSVLAGLMALLSTCDTHNALPAAIGISAILGAMSVSLRVLRGQNAIPAGAVKALYVMSGVVAILATILGVMSALKVTSGTIKVATSISELLVIMSGCLSILSLIKVNPATAISAALGLSAFTGIITALVAIAAAVDKAFPKLKSFLNGGFELLKTIAFGLGEIVGDLIGGFVDGVFDCLPSLAESLGMFSQNLKPFLDNMSNVDRKALTGAKTLAGTLLMLTGSELLDSLAGIFGSKGFDGLGEKLASLGNGIIAFSDVVSNSKIDVDAVKNAAKVGKSIIELASEIPRSGGLIQEFIGEIDIEGFSRKLNSLATGMVEYSDIISSGNINVEIIENSAKCLKSIVEVANEIPKQGGILQELVGVSDLEDFAGKLKAAANGMKQYNNIISVSNFDKDKILESVDAYDAILKVADKVPKANGAWQTIAGEKDLSAFGNKLKTAAEGLKGYYDTISGSQLDVSKIQASIIAFGSVIDLCSKFTSDEYEIDPNFDYELAGNQMTLIGGLVQQCSSMVAGKTVKIGDINNFKNAVLEVASIFANIKIIASQSKLLSDDLSTDEMKELPSWVTSTSAMMSTMLNTELSKSHNAEFNTISSNLNGLSMVIKNATAVDVSNFKTFISTLSDTTEELSNIRASRINTAKFNAQLLVDMCNVFSGTNLEGLSHFLSTMTQLGKGAVNGILDSFKNSEVDCKNAMSTFSYAITTALMMESGNIMNCGVSLRTEFMKGFSNVVELASKAILNAIDTAANRAMTKQYVLYQAGVNVAEGLINGMKSKLNEAKQVGMAMGDAVDRGTRQSLDIHSPSRVMKKNAMWTWKGYTDELLKNGVKNVKTATETMFKIMSSEGYKKVIKDDLATDIVSAYKKSYGKSTKMIKGIVSNFYKSVYEKSDYYKDDKKQLNDDIKKLRDLYKELHKTSKLVSSSNGGKSAKTAKSQVKELQKEISAAKKAIKKDNDEIRKHIIASVKEIKKSIKDMAKSYLDISNVNRNSIDLFDTSKLGNNVNEYAEMLSSVSNSLKDSMTIFNINMNDSTDIFSKFAGAAEDKTKDIAEAQTELSEATDELANAEKELSYWRAKDKIVLGRSQMFIDKIKESEEKLTEAKKKQIEAQKKLDELSNDTSTQEILDNMKSNIDGVKELEQNLQTLADRGINEGLLKSLKDLGTNGAEQVRTFVKMTDDELTKAGEYFDKYNKLSGKKLIDGFADKKDAMIAWGDAINRFSKLNLDATVKATLMEEFQNQGTDSINYINTILNMSKKELKQFNSDYIEILKVPDQVATEVIKARQKIDGKKPKEKTAENDASMYIDAMRENLKAEQEYMSNLEKLKKRKISSELYDYLKSMGSNSADLIKSFLDASDAELKEANKLFGESSKQTADEWIKGFQENISNEEMWSKHMTQLSKLDIPKKIKKSLYQKFQEEGVDSDETLQMILGMNKKQMNDFVKAYTKSLSLPEKTSNIILAGLVKIDAEKETLRISKSVKKSVKSASEQVASDMDALTSPLSKAAVDCSGKILKTLQSKINKKAGKTMAEHLLEGIEEGIKNMPAVLTKGMDASKTLGGALNDKDKTLKSGSTITAVKKSTPNIATSLLSGVSSISSIAYDMAKSVASSEHHNQPSMITQDNSDNRQFNFNNEFHITSTQPQTTAQEVNRIMQQLVERRGRVWQ